MRKQIKTFERRFEDLSRRTFTLLERTGDDRLYGLRSIEGRSIGEYILRSAGAVEQMVGGITRRLWDDPFEWTLPERMPTVDAIIDYLNEVDSSRSSGFLFLARDEELTRLLPAPVEMRSLGDILIDTLDRSEAYLIKAETLFDQHRD